MTAQPWHNEHAAMSAPRTAVAGWKGGWYVVPYQVTWRDLDALGHVNNAVYLTYFELARTKYWMDLTGGSKAHDISFIVARTECNFRQQLGFLEDIEIRVRVGEIRSSSFDFDYEIARDNGTDIAADGKVVVVHFDWQSNSKRTIDDELRRKIDDFQRE
jgi:acyl-CoA thioester hydrolase